MAIAYDDQNVFAKILRGEIPNDTVAENDHALAFNDITPQAPIHVLVIPKGAYVTFDEFHARASAAEITDFYALVSQIIAEKGMGAEAGGYRVISNAGVAGMQEVPHYHLHLLGGRALGRLVAPE